MQTVFSFGKRKFSYFKVSCWTTRAKFGSTSSMCVCFMVAAECPSVGNAEGEAVSGQISVWKQLEIPGEDRGLWLVFPLPFDSCVLDVTTGCRSGRGNCVSPARHFCPVPPVEFKYCCFRLRLAMEVPSLKSRCGASFPAPVNKAVVSGADAPSCHHCCLQEGWEPAL